MPYTVLPENIPRGLCPKQFCRTIFYRDFALNSSAEQYFIGLLAHTILPENIPRGLWLKHFC